MLRARGHSAVHGAPVQTGRPAFTELFGVDQAPLVQGGRWYHTPNWWTYMVAEGGVCHGTNGPLDRYDDSYAILRNATGDYLVEVEIARSPSLNTSLPHEFEIHFCARETNGGLGIQTIELLLAHQGHPQMFTWDHAPDGGTNFVEVASSGGAVSIGANADGDILQVERAGANYQVRKWNGSSFVVLANYSTSTYTTGELAIGGFTRPGGNLAHYGVRRLTVVPT